MKYIATKKEKKKKASFQLYPAAIPAILYLQTC